ncbi:MAG: N-acetylmuramoyl-L-alanine amidase [Solirubrobacteraceae bacterium]|nr:N-acetylmuramoyl-L-alanine amidase [Solirubrobacteraceae bacterium]
MTRARAVPAASALALVALLCPAALAARASAADAPLRGRTIVLNPGHNGANASAPAQINRLVGIGQGQTKACDTTGTATDGGYSEAALNWDVALRARRVLRRRGATVVLTRPDNHSVGPCIDERARIANRTHADATVSIHADGASPAASGFHVIEPALIGGLTDDVFGASHRLALAVRGAFRAATGEPYATYVGRDGLVRRDDLGGLRLADVPSIFIEMGNMRNADDARRMLRGAYRLRAARGIANGIQRYLAR